MTRAVVAAHPTHVIHQLTALPKGGPKSARDLEATNRLRIDGTRNLIAAAIAAGATRIVGGSFALIGGVERPACQPDVGGGRAPSRSMESQILDANRAGAIEGVVLRYGLFYGPDTASTHQMIAMARRRLLPAIRGDRSLLPCIHVDDAASATVAALDRAPAGSIYDIVDDRAGQLQRDRARRRRCGGRAAADRGTIVAAAARRAVHGADDLACGCRCPTEGARRAGLAPVVSDDARRASRRSRAHAA